MVEVEKAGIPVVLITTTEFEGLAKSSAASFGVSDLCMVVVPHPIGMIPLEEVRAKVDTAFPEILTAATQWKPQASGAVEAQEPYPAETLETKGTVEDVVDLYYQKGWTDGLPIIPPTAERVANMLTGTTRKPDEIIGMVPPRNGILTVEVLAANAAMAGCKPEYMPVLIAAMEAILDTAHGWQAQTTTTNPVAPLVLVNGPIVKELGIGYSTGALGGGPGLRPNVTIGRAINLIGDIVGGSKPPEADKTTLGQTANIIAMVVGENEDANPWEPLHVSLGYSADASTVTVFGARTRVNFNLHDSKTAEDLMQVFAHTMASAGMMAENMKPCSPSNMEVLILSPEHAEQIADEGWTKESFRQYLWENTRLPLSVYALRFSANPGKLVTALECYEDYESWDGIPLVREPEDLAVFVAGGPGKHSVYMSTNGYSPVTKEIEK